MVKSSAVLLCPMKFHDYGKFITVSEIRKVEDQKALQEDTTMDTKAKLLADIKKNCNDVDATLKQACAIASAAAAEGRLTELDLETMKEATETFVTAAQELERGARGEGARKVG